MPLNFQTAQVFSWGAAFTPLHLTHVGAPTNLQCTGNSYVEATSGSRPYFGRFESWLEFFPSPLYFKLVGKTYLFECPQCQYRIKVSGGADSGLHCEIQTIICRDCRQLYDVFLRQRRRADAADLVKFPGFHRPDIPPVVLGESSVTPSKKPPAKLAWRDTELTCPVEPEHFVEAWNDPGRCPRCGNFMEKNGYPFRAWD